MEKQTYTDQEIITGIQAGGTAKRRITLFLHSQYAGFVYKGMRQYRLEKEDAIDAFGDAIIGFCRRVEQEHFQLSGNLAGYLYRSFCNRCVDRTRKRSSISVEWVDMMPSLPEKAKNALKTLLLQEKMEQVVEGMNALGEKCKRLLLESEYYGFSPEELVERLGMKDTNTLSSQKYRCMTKLRKWLAKHNIGTEE